MRRQAHKVPGRNQALVFFFRLEFISEHEERNQAFLLEQLHHISYEVGTCFGIITCTCNCVEVVYN
jgi:hypothetical protein